MVITYDVTKDIRFKQGEAVGKEKGKQEARERIIRKLLTMPGCSLRSIANVADVSVAVVKRIKNGNGC